MKLTPQNCTTITSCRLVCGCVWRGRPRSRAARAVQSRVTTARAFLGKRRSLGSGCPETAARRCPVLQAHHHVLPPSQVAATSCTCAAEACHGCGLASHANARIVGRARAESMGLCRQPTSFWRTAATPAPAHEGHVAGGRVWCCPRGAALGRHQQQQRQQRHHHSGR